MSTIGLLESVRKYHPRKGTDPLENFITEAFAWMLNDCPEFGTHFVNEILKNLDFPDFDSNNIRWETQMNFDGVFPDMVCHSMEDSSARKALVFEHKTGSHVHSNQISNYKTHAAKKYNGNSRVILITANSHQHIYNSNDSDTPDYQLCWRNVYSSIETFLRESQQTQFILKDFMKLIESVGMGPSAPVSQDSIRYYYLTKDLKNNIGNLLKNVEERNWLSRYEKYQNLELIKKRGTAYRQQHGRICLEFRISNQISFCIGFVLDGGNDMGAKPLNKNLGPDMTIVLIFGQEAYDRYPSLPEYNELKIQLKKKTDNNKDGWFFYDNTADQNRIRYNK